MKEEINLICFKDSDKVWDEKEIDNICNKTAEYTKTHNISEYTIDSIEDNTWSDKENQRYDIVIKYHIGPEDRLICQRLLMLKGEVINALEFHDRFNEFYGEESENETKEEDEYELDM